MQTFGLNLIFLSTFSPKVCIICIFSYISLIISGLYNKSFLQTFGLNPRKWSTFSPKVCKRLLIAGKQDRWGRFWWSTLNQSHYQRAAIWFSSVRAHGNTPDVFFITPYKNKILADGIFFSSDGFFVSPDVIVGIKSPMPRQDSLFASILRQKCCFLAIFL